MTTRTLVIIGILLLLIGGGGYYFLVYQNPTSSTGGTSSSNLFAFLGLGNATSTSGGSGNSVPGIPGLNTNVMAVQGASGVNVVVKDFRTLSTTVEDPSNPGTYYLAGGVQEQQTNAPYQIFYSDTGQSFGITIYSEPFGQFRKEAEQQLMTELGITQAQMCNLTYYLSTGPGLSSIYSQENLGFSFCPGAVALPD